MFQKELVWQSRFISWRSLPLPSLFMHSWVLTTHFGQSLAGRLLGLLVEAWLHAESLSHGWFPYRYILCWSDWTIYIIQPVRYLCSGSMLHGVWSSLVLTHHTLKFYSYKKNSNILLLKHTGFTCSLRALGHLVGFRVWKTIWRVHLVGTSC